MTNSKRTLVKLKDLCETLTVGFVGSMSPEYVSDGVPMLRSLNIKPFVLNLQDLKYISIEFHNRISKSSLNEGDVVIVRTGLPGTCCVIPNGFTNLNCSDLVIARPDKTKLNPYYLSFFFNSIAKAYVSNQLVGAIQQHFNVGSAKEMIIDLPSLAEQNLIAKVFNDLNRKIELNNRINEELEGMAKLLYDYWFVQFDFPISEEQAIAMGKPELKGKPYKSSGGAMVYNEQLKREVPEGWEVRKLKSEMDVQYGYPFSTKMFSDNPVGKPIIRIRDILNNTISTYSSEVVDDKYRLQKLDLIIGMDGNFHMNFWDKDNCWLNQRCVRIRERNLSSASTYQAYQDIKPYIEARERNVSRTTVGHLSAKDIEGLNVMHAPENKFFRHKSFFNSILEKIIKNRNENHQLAELRDWLLPMLMNGQVRVGEAKRYHTKEELSIAAESKEAYS